ncbi:MAG: hypothetical protein Q4A75_05810 [Peptostreptococcaceae bacterium]|nr:hypothetical protein [Peptostreptococcaceae bacterium]
MMQPSRLQAAARDPVHRLEIAATYSKDRPRGRSLLCFTSTPFKESRE